MFKSVQFVIVDTTLLCCTQPLLFYGLQFRFQFLVLGNKKCLHYAFCVNELRSGYFEYLQRYLNKYLIDIQPF